MKEIDTLAKIIWDYMLMHHELKPMDAIFILGSSDLRVADRASELFHQGYANTIICSGLGGKNTPFNRPEAEIFAESLQQQGVPKENILLEPRATNTGENVIFTKKLLEEKGLHYKSFILVQKPYMERRSYATFKKQWPEAECLVTSPQLSYEEYMGTDEDFKIARIKAMVGDLERIKEYPQKGFQIPQEIPDQVWQAGQKLVEIGYTKGLVK